MPPLARKAPTYTRSAVTSSSVKEYASLRFDFKSATDAFDRRILSRKMKIKGASGDVWKNTINCPSHAALEVDNSLVSLESRVNSQ